MGNNARKASRQNGGIFCYMATETTRVNQENALKTGSFLSRAFRATVGGVQSFIKIYNRGNYYSGALNLTLDPERTRIMQSEVNINGVLAPGLHTRKDFVSVNGTTEEAIFMEELSSGSFWYDQIRSDAPIQSEKLAAVAQNLAKFHFDEGACPLAGIEEKKYSDVLRDRLINEIGFNKRLSGGAVPEELFQKWELLISGYIDKNTDLLEFRHTDMQEPRICHGDVKTDNIADHHGSPQIIDPASVVAWQTLDRRMDAHLLVVDLEVLGRGEEAAQFWQDYTTLYNDKIFSKITNPDQRKQVVQSNTVIDRISLLHRLGLLYSVARYKIEGNKDLEFNQNLAERTFERLQQAYQELETELNSGQ